MQFSYIALSPEYQRLTGVISADTERAARDQLHAMGLSVISISEYTGQGGEETQSPQTPATQTQGITTFYFKVLNNKGQELDGTIDSTDRKTAFKRLVGEYRFKVLALCPASVPPEARPTEGIKGIEELSHEVEEEFGITSDETETKGSEDEFSAHEKDEYFLRQKTEVLKEVEEVGKQAEEILNIYQEKLNGEDTQAIRDQLNTLMRIRLSNNLQHIRNLTEKLFVVIDGVLQKYTETEEGGEALEETPVEDDMLVSTEANYQEGIERDSALGNIKMISQKMRNLLRTRKKTAIRKPKTDDVITLGAKPKTNPVVVFLRNFFGNLQGALFSKSSMRRKAYIDKLKVSWAEFKKGWQAMVVQKEMQALTEKDRKSIKKAVVKESPLFSEARIFIAWFLGFYIFYFFIAFYTKFKWGESAPIFDFINRSLSSSFLFAFAGVLFLLFLALSLKARFSPRNPLFSTVIFLSTTVLILLFLFNF